MNTEWKPIASAPKDGTEILVFHPEGGVCAAFCPGEGFAWHCMDGMNTVIGKKSRQSIPVMTSFMEPPTHWMPLPPAPTSHPIPTGATGDRDWELSCDECNGSGHVFVKHQVAERKTDVQEFKEECECCEGRGFNIAFEDIPGIAEYVKSCRPAAVAAGDALLVEALRASLQALEAISEEMTVGERYTNAGQYLIDALPLARDALTSQAPQQGDARDAARYRWLARKVGGHGVIDGWAFAFPTHLTLPAPSLVIRDPEAALGQAIDAAIAAIAQQKGEA